MSKQSAFAKQLKGLPLQPDPLLDALLHIPPSDGGFGLPGANITAPAAYATAWAKTIHAHTHTHTLLENTQVATLYNECYQTLCTLANTSIAPVEFVQKATLPKAQTTIQKTILKQRREDLYQKLTTETQTHLLSQSGKGAGAWLMPPTEHHQFLLDEEYITLSRLRAFQAVFQSQHHCRHKNHCRECTAGVDIWGEHALMCGLGGGWLAQHNDMRDQLHKEASIILDRPALLE